MTDDLSSFGPRPSRRAFLHSMAILAAAAACERDPYRPGDFTRPAVSPVALLPADRYNSDLEGLIIHGLDLLQVDVRGRRVLLKPNMVEYERDKAINSHPAVVAAAATAMLKRGAARVTIGEGPGHRRDMEYLLKGTGMQDVLQELRVKFVDLNHDDVRRVSLRSNFSGLGEVWLPTSVLEADFVVSMPKLKTHHFAGMTASMKNLFGTVPGAVYGWPKNVLHFHGIEQSIVDLVATIRPALTIVDGIVAMEGDGPIMGRPRELGVIAMATDVVAADATCARIIGLDPAKMPYLAVSGAFMGNTAEARIVQRGEMLARYRTTFEVIPSIRKMMT